MGAPVLCTENKSGASDFDECVLGAVVSGSRSGQDWMPRALSRYLYEGWLVGAYLGGRCPFPRLDHAFTA